MHFMRAATIVALISLFSSTGLFSATPAELLRQAIKNGDSELFEQALAKNANINEVDPGTGRTPSMDLLFYFVPEVIAYHDRCSTLAWVAAVPGILGAAAGAVVGWFGGMITHRSHKEDIVIVGAAAVGATAGGLTAGYGSRALLKLIFARSMAKRNEARVSMFNRLLEQQNLDVNVKNPFNGIDLAQMLTMLVKPTYISYTSTSYNHYSVPVGDLNIGYSSPQTNVHMAVRLDVDTQVYSVSESSYKENFAPVFNDLLEKVRRHSSYNLRV
jgi:hypothetical protein